MTSSSRNETSQSPECDQANDEVEPAHGGELRIRLAGAVVGLAWIVNLTLLIAAFVWVACSGRSAQSIELVLHRLGWHEPANGLVVRAPERFGPAVAAIEFGLAAAGVAFIFMFIGLFAGPRRVRTMKAWLAMTALVCGWLGLLVAWPEIYWRGQVFRVGYGLGDLELIARDLRDDWPNDDAEIDGVGPFLAYPKGRPSTLLLLGEGTIPNSALRVSAIERLADGELYFQLSGDEQGAWAVWSPERTPPKSFVNGLDTAYEVLRYRQIGPEWFLVRFRAHRSGASLD